MEWISVKDRLPEAEGNYLVVAAGVRLVAGNAVKCKGHFIACYTDKYKAWIVNLNVTKSVTHWMELPELPEEE